MRLNWSDAIKDLTLISQKVESLRLVTGAKGIEKLSEFSQLESLWCFNINHEKLENICNCVSLENLYIDTLKTDDFSCFRKLRFLKVLSLYSCSKTNSLNELSVLQNLEGLQIENFKNVYKIDALSTLVNLQQLAVAGSMWTRMTIESLKPLSSLRNLKYLNLTNVKVKDESLKPLANLKQLEELGMANFYLMEEFAWLSGRLKKTKCSWFSPYVELPFDCSKCGKDTMLMLTGRGKKNLCKECDYKRLKRHITEFEKIASNAT